MSVEIRQLKDANGYVFVPMTHWDAISNKPDIALHSDILTKTSLLINDSSFVTKDDLAIIDLSAYAKNASLQDVSARIPTLTSQLINDSSFVTLQELEDDEVVIAGNINDIYRQIADISNNRGTTYIAGTGIDISNGIISTSIGNATQTISGLMSSLDKAKLDGLVNYVLPIASSTDLGGIKVGNGLSISNDGILSTSIFVPAKTSDLVNDSSFITLLDLIDDEIVIAAAINDLHDLIIDVSNRGGGGTSYIAGRDIDISNGIISVSIGNASTLQEIISNYETRIAALERIVEDQQTVIATIMVDYENRLQNLETIGEIGESLKNQNNPEE